MKVLRLLIFVAITFISVSMRAQMFRPLGLNIEDNELLDGNFQPRIHIEGEFIFIYKNGGIVETRNGFKAQVGAKVIVEDGKIE